MLYKHVAAGRSKVSLNGNSRKLTAAKTSLLVSLALGCPLIVQMFVQLYTQQSVSLQTLTAVCPVVSEKTPQQQSLKEKHVLSTYNMMLLTAQKL